MHLGWGEESFATKPTRTEQVFGGVPIAVDSAAKQVRQLEQTTVRLVTRQLHQLLARASKDA